MAALTRKHLCISNFRKQLVKIQQRQVSSEVKTFLENDELDLANGRQRTFGKPGSPSALKEQLMPGEEFRTLLIPGHNLEKGSSEKRKHFDKQIIPRQISMSVDQDWTDTWPTAKTFNWSAVPLPIRQGRVYGAAENDGISPAAYGNVELMKIPNFLHLTPVHIKKHTKALKPFCTKWPKGLEGNKKSKLLKKHFPVEVIRRSYIADGLTTRDERARLVTIKVPISVFNLKGHGLDKLKRLVGDRLDEKSGIITLEADRCPTKVQNYDYLQYLLNALYFESLEKRDWEDDKEPQDEEIYTLEQQPAYEVVNQFLDHAAKVKNQTAENVEEFSKQKDDIVKCVKNASENLHNIGENKETLDDYKQAMKKMLIDFNKTSLKDTSATNVDC